MLNSISNDFDDLPDQIVETFGVSDKQRMIYDWRKRWEFMRNLESRRLSTHRER